MAKIPVDILSSLSIERAAHPAIRGIRLKDGRTVHLQHYSAQRWVPKLKYGVRSPNFNWALCAQLYSLTETPKPPPPHPPPAFGLIYEGGIGQPR
jgi:hypothetical protein